MLIKRQAAGWKKLFAKHISNKRLVSRIYQECLQLNKNTTQFFLMGKKSELTLHREDAQIEKGIRKDAQHHMSLGKCKLRPQ